MTEKLLPGIPHSTRIAILQQTDEEVEGNTPGNVDTRSGMTVLGQVMSSSRRVLSRGFRRCLQHRHEFILNCLRYYASANNIQ